MLVLRWAHRPRPAQRQSREPGRPDLGSPDAGARSPRAGAAGVRVSRAAAEEVTFQRLENA